LGPLFSSDRLSKTGTQASRYPAINAFLILAVLFAVGSLLPLSEKLHFPHFSGVDLKTLLHEQESQLTDAGLSIADVQSFLSNPGAEIAIGRALYPRFYPTGRGEILLYPYVEMGFPRTGFILIGPKGEQGILLPGEAPKHFPHGADVLVLGCKEQNYTDALVVLILDETRAVYTRSPMSDLTCPLKQPVCDDNHVCK